MDEAIKLLREQAILCSRLLELLNKLSESLTENSNSNSIEEIIQKMDPLVGSLSKNSNRSKDFLSKSNYRNFGEFMDATENGVHKDVAMRLLSQVMNLQERLADKMKLSAQLLVKGSEFVNFNLNVLSQTTAAPTYGAAAQTATNSNRRIFDANI